MSKIAWSDPPRNDTPRVGVQIVTATVYERYFRLLGEVVGVELHWAATRSLPCRGPGCLYCEQSGVEAARWHGYAPALLWNPVANGGRGDWVVCVLSVTEAMLAQLGEQHGQGKTLRGLVVGVKRGAKQRSRVELRIREHPANDPPVECFDVKPILLRTWGVREQPATQQESGADQGDILAFPERPPERPPIESNQQENPKRGTRAPQQSG